MRGRGWFCSKGQKDRIQVEGNGCGKTLAAREKQEGTVGSRSQKRGTKNGSGSGSDRKGGAGSMCEGGRKRETDRPDTDRPDTHALSLINLRVSAIWPAWQGHGHGGGCQACPEVQRYLGILFLFPPVWPTSHEPVIVPRGNYGWIPLSVIDDEIGYVLSRTACEWPELTRFLTGRASLITCSIPALSLRQYAQIPGPRCK